MNSKLFQSLIVPGQRLYLLYSSHDVRTGVNFHCVRVSSCYYRSGARFSKLPVIIGPVRQFYFSF